MQERAVEEHGREALQAGMAEEPRLGDRSSFPKRLYLVSETSIFNSEMPILQWKIQSQKCMGTVKTRFYIGEMFQIMVFLFEVFQRDTAQRQHSNSTLCRSCGQTSVPDMWCGTKQLNMQGGAQHQDGLSVLLSITHLYIMPITILNTVYYVMYSVFAMSSCGVQCMFKQGCMPSRQTKSARCCRARKNTVGKTDTEICAGGLFAGIS